MDSAPTSDAENSQSIMIALRSRCAAISLNIVSAVRQPSQVGGHN
jgi:hypothetical protein